MDVILIVVFGFWFIIMEDYFGGKKMLGGMFGNLWRILFYLYLCVGFNVIYFRFWLVLGVVIGNLKEFMDVVVYEKCVKFGLDKFLDLYLVILFFNIWIFSVVYKLIG